MRKKLLVQRGASAKLVIGARTILEWATYSAINAAALMTVLYQSTSFIQCSRESGYNSTWRTESSENESVKKKRKGNKKRGRRLNRQSSKPRWRCKRCRRISQAS